MTRQSDSFQRKVGLVTSAATFNGIDPKKSRFTISSHDERGRRSNSVEELPQVRAHCSDFAESGADLVDWWPRAKSRPAIVDIPRG